MWFPTSFFSVQYKMYHTYLLSGLIVRFNRLDFLKFVSSTRVCCFYRTRHFPLFSYCVIFLWILTSRLGLLTIFGIDKFLSLREMTPFCIHRRTLLFLTIEHPSDKNWILIAKGYWIGGGVLVNVVLKS